MSSTLVLTCFCNNTQCKCSTAHICICISPMAKPFPEQAKAIFKRLTVPGAFVLFMEQEVKNVDAPAHYYSRFTIRFYNNNIFEANKGISLSWFISNITQWLGDYSLLKVDLRDYHISSAPPVSTSSE